MRMGRDAAWLLIGLFTALWIQDTFAARESDEQKWERLAKQKEQRRAIEFKYESCMSQCRKTCK